MSRDGLREFSEYLEDRIGVLKTTEGYLCELQEKYETFFAEVSRVRESELEQLREHILTHRGRLPADLDPRLDEALERQQAAFDQELGTLEARHQRLKQEAAALRARSADEEQATRRLNLELDAEEEALKERNEKLLASIERYNRRIRELGSGFGFFRNLFRMRRLANRRRELDQEQADVAARIRDLRRRWEQTGGEFETKEQERKAQWIELHTEAASIGTKLEYLRSARTRIIERGALEQVLFARRPELPEPSPEDPPCERCGQPNPPSHHFCRICALRLVSDRPDLEGSLAEIAEVNNHLDRFSEGMQACQEIIGLVRGLHSGVSALKVSVDDMQQTEKKHRLERLRIQVPTPSREFGRHFEALQELATRTGQSVHPRVFAQRIQGLVAKTFTEQQITGWFEGMGQELTRQAEAQW